MKRFRARRAEQRGVSEVLTLSGFNRGDRVVVTGFSPGPGTELASAAACVPSEDGVRVSSPIERRVMSHFMRKMSRRAIVQALIALPALSLFRNQPAAGPDEIVPNEIIPDEIIEINGWILRRSDLA